MRSILLLIILGLALSFTLQQEVFNASTLVKFIDTYRQNTGRTPSIKIIGTTNVLQLMSNLAQYQLGQLKSRGSNATLCAISPFNNNLNQNLRTYAPLGINNFQGCWGQAFAYLVNFKFTTHQALFTRLLAENYFQQLINQTTLQFGIGIADIKSGTCSFGFDFLKVFWVHLSYQTPFTCANPACTFPTQAPLPSTIQTPTTPTTTNTNTAPTSVDGYSVPAASASNGGQPFLPTTKKFDNGTVYTLASNEMWVNQARCNPALPNKGYPSGHLPSGYLAAVNKARSNPLYYRNLLTQKHAANSLTSGGIDYYKIAYNFLTAAQSNVTANPKYFPNYIINIGLNSAAQYMAEIQSKQSHEGCVAPHRGPGNTYFKNRFDGFFNTNTYIGENIAWTPPSLNPTPESVVLQWIIDFQVPSFGHRDSIFSKQFTHYGHGATHLTTQTTRFNCVSISGNTITRNLDYTFTTPSILNVQVFATNPVCHKPDCSCDSTKTTTKCVYCLNL